MIAMDLEATLLDLGIAQVSLAASVEEALALLEAMPVDAVLLDLFLGAQRSLPVADLLARRGIPFALVTGYGDTRDAMAGFADVPRLRKPHTQGELMAILERLC